MRAPKRVDSTDFANVHLVVPRALMLVVPHALTGRRTVAAALRAAGLARQGWLGRAGSAGLARQATYHKYHRVLSRAVWSPRRAARQLLAHLTRQFAPADGPLVFGIGETIERRWGAKIKARGIYRDPVRSSGGHFVKASGLRWLSMMLLAPASWAGRVWALPFLTVLCPSQHYNEKYRGRHKKLTVWARQMICQLRRWLPGRELVVVGDSSFAAIELLAAASSYATIVTRLRLDAALYAPAPPRRAGASPEGRAKRASACRNSKNG